MGTQTKPMHTPWKPRHRRRLGLGQDHVTMTRTNQTICIITVFDLLPDGRNQYNTINERNHTPCITVAIPIAGVPTRKTHTNSGNGLKRACSNFLKLELKERATKMLRMTWVRHSRQARANEPPWATGCISDRHTAVLRKKNHNALTLCPDLTTRVLATMVVRPQARRRLFSSTATLDRHPILSNNKRYGP